MKVARQLLPECHKLFDCATDVGESPLWDAKQGRLYRVDISGGGAHYGDPATPWAGSVIAFRVACPGWPIGAFA